jgi:hypothetical protein
MKWMIALLLTGTLMLSGCFEEMDINSKKGELFEGAYDMVAGSGDELKCYCDNSGYVIDEKGERTPVCFTQVEKVKCNYISLRGEEIVKTIVPSLTSQCPVGDMAFYKVLSYKCLDEMPSEENKRKEKSGWFILR